MSLSFRLFRNSIVRFNKSRVVYGRCSSSQSNTATSEDIIDITSVEDVPKYEKQLTEQEAQEILEKRNKSRLSRTDRNRVSDLPPFNNEDLTWFHQTIRYKKRMFGRFGIEGLNVSPGALWPLEEEILDKIEFEKAATPHTVQEGWALISKRNHENAEEIRLREEEIATKIGKVNQWRKELAAKIAKREANTLAIKERKERLIEEVRRQFGFRVDPRDDRFQQALEQKEKEDKKLRKEAKKQENRARVMARLMAGKTSTNEEPTQTGNTEKKEE